jgi:hypothetical protein
MSVIYIQRITGSTNSLVEVQTSDSTATATASGYITAQADNIAALNEGAWTWETNDMILLVASDGNSWCSINSTFTTLSSLGSLAPVVDLTSVTSATPGTVRAITGLISQTATTMTSGNIVGVRGAVNMVGASGGFVYGVQGKVIPTGTLSGSVWVAPVFAQLDISGATVNAAQLAPVWADYGATSGTMTDATGCRMFAGTNTTAATLNSMIYLYGKSTNLLELSGSSSTYISTAAGTTPSGDLKKLAITIDGVTHYILAAAVWS